MPDALHVALPDSVPHFPASTNNEPCKHPPCFSCLQDRDPLCVATVVQNIVCALEDYGVADDRIFGIKFGLRGFYDRAAKPMHLNRSCVEGIHLKGGTLLVSPACSTYASDAAVFCCGLYSLSERLQCHCIVKFADYPADLQSEYCLPDSNMLHWHMPFHASYVPACADVGATLSCPYRSPSSPQALTFSCTNRPGASSA